MSFFTSFCDLPQKEHWRLPWVSSLRRSTKHLNEAKGESSARPPGWQDSHPPRTPPRDAENRCGSDGLERAAAVSTPRGRHDGDPLARDYDEAASKWDRGPRLLHLRASSNQHTHEGGKIYHGKRTEALLARERPAPHSPSGSSAAAAGRLPSTILAFSRRKPRRRVSSSSFSSWARRSSRYSARSLAMCLPVDSASSSSFFSTSASP